MYTYKYGGNEGTSFHLDIAEDLVVVRTKKNKDISKAITSKSAKNILSQLLPITEFPEAGVSVLQCRQTKDRLVQLRDNVRQMFKNEKDVDFAGRVLRDVNTGSPVVYTENLFVKLGEHLSNAKCSTILKKHKLKIKRKLNYSKNAFFVSASKGTGLEIFQIVQNLLNEESVDLCHPELIHRTSNRSVSPQQWHLHKTQVNGNTINAHVNVIDAWKISKGENITIAVIDDGVDIDHEEFDMPGKIVHPRDVTLKTNNARPQHNNNKHGTACAGVACAAGKFQSSGVAPEAKLMPIRKVSGLGSQAEADAFEWAADHGADIISCSWGPFDGDWWNPSDSLHNQVEALPDSTRLAIDYAVQQGRDGKGCVITWAAGNGNESVENDGYASYNKVIAVAASNDRNKRSVYSDFGKSVWCSFPSNDFGHQPFNHQRPLTPGIWSTDREGLAGYNPGVLNPSIANPPGDDHGNYTENFGGTSSACPGIAGIAALILSANPDLRWDEVKDILRRASDKIDQHGGSYDNNGHSPFYGYGRTNASRAVQLAKSGTVAKIKELSMKAVAKDTLKKTGEKKMFMIDLKAPATVTLDGPEGFDYDLYVKRDNQPTTDDYDLRGYTSSADEKLLVNPSTPGRYYILVHSFKGKGKFTLQIELN